MQSGDRKGNHPQFLKSTGYRQKAIIITPFQVGCVLGLRGTRKTPELRTVSVPLCAL